MTQSLPDLVYHPAMATRIDELAQNIQKARQGYYNGNPTISDELYDAWVDELADLQENHPEVTAVGAAPTGAWPKVVHTAPMGSLDKVNTVDQLTTWVNKVTRPGRHEELLVSEKLDGISINLVYDNAHLVQAVTRGDGSTGEEITQNVMRMQGVLPKLPVLFTGSIRGEIVLHRDALAEHFPDKANTRNTAAGTAKRFDGTGCEHLSVYCYRVHGEDGAEQGPQKLSDHFENLEKWGLKTPAWYVTAMAHGVMTPQDLWVEYQQTRRDTLPYDIDGLVVSVNDLAHLESLGVSDMRPNGERAFKFAPVTRETVLRRIDWQVGGTGRVTPVGFFDTVSLLGTSVSQATLYNSAYIRQIGADIGARILVARANDVIPRIVSVVAGTGKVALPPTHCPCCGSELVTDGAYLVCANHAACPAQNEGRIKFWIKEQGILEWGTTLIKKLCENGLVKGVPDLYRLSVDDLAKLPRMGDRSAQVAHEMLHAKNPISLENVLGGLTIPNVGTTMARALVDAGLDTWEKILGATMDQLVAVPGFGLTRAGALHRWCRSIGVALIPELLAAGVKIKARVRGGLTGKSFCFTGTMQHKRAELEAMVEAAGGVVKKSVTKGLSYLVITDPNSTTGKAQSARKNGTTCISEDDFLSMVFSG
jgi:DNA ligase (NAD+)